MTSLPLTPQVFSILAGLVEDRSGIHFDARDRELFAGKVTPRALAAGFESLLDYYYFLRYDPAGRAELDLLVEALCVHESYFFREAAALSVLVDSVVRPALADGRTARIWCAASAHGEEPLTLAMMLADQALLGGVEIVASDISAAALARARTGVFGPRSARALPPGVVGRWLEPREAGFEVHPDLVRRVSWRRVNLVDVEEVAALGSFDGVVCRNVLIYFGEATARRLAERLAERLAPGGVLVVGASESLLRFGTVLACEERGGVFLYRARR